MKNQTCCFTGHRAIPETEYAEIQFRLKSEIVRLIKQGVCYLGAGGALGFDTMAALTVLDLKKEYPHIRLIMVLPCRNQTKGWNGYDVKVYDHILQKADKVVYLAEQYDMDCIRRRNEHLVDHSEYCICYFTGKKGGTAYTVGYAINKGLYVMNLARGENNR